MKSRARAFVFLTFVAFASFGAIAHSAFGGETEKVSASVDVLFSSFGKSPGLFAKFQEEKKITLLVAPLKSGGTIHFDRKRGLARHTLAPTKQSVLLSNGSLTFWDGKKAEVVRLDKAPALRAFADGFDLLLRGDRAGIERSFRLEFSGDPKADWIMRLTPLKPELRTLVASLEVKGKGETLSSLLVQESNGDSTTTTFSEVDAKKVYAERDADLVFKAPPTP